MNWIKQYQREWLKHDALAGMTLAAYAVPVSLAYASLAGVPPQNGIYCYLAGGIFYACFGTSRQLAIGPTSAISMLVGVTIAGMGINEPDRWTAVVGLTALMVAVFCGIAYVLRLSTLVNFISATILVGFKAGAAITIAMTQLPKLFGVPGGGDHLFERIWILFTQLNEMNVMVLGTGVVAVILLALGDRYFPGRPIALIVVAISIVSVATFSLGNYGVSTVGIIPQGLPSLRLPSLRLRDVDGVIPLAFACFILAFIEGISAARTLAMRHDYKISTRRELLGLGAANVAVALAQGFPVAGGLSQSVVNDKAGAKSPLALVFASLALALCLLFLTGLLANLPNAVLAAIVLVAVKSLIDLDELRHLYRVSRHEFSISMIALIGVLLLGILKGVMLAVIISLLMLLRGAANPHVALLGRIPGSRRFSDRERHPDNREIAGALAFRIEGSLLYFNIDHLLDVMWEKINAAPTPRLVVLDLSNAPTIDVAGATMLTRLHQDLRARDIDFRVVYVRSKNRDLLHAEGLDEQVGYLNRQLTLEDVIEEFEQSRDG